MQGGPYPSVTAERLDNAALKIEHISGKGLGILAAKKLRKGQKVEAPAQCSCFRTCEIVRSNKYEVLTLLLIEPNELSVQISSSQA